MTSSTTETAPTFYPGLRYRDARAAIAWLCKAFGFAEQAVYGEGDVVHHAQLTFGNGIVMLGSSRPDSYGRSPAELGGAVSSTVYVYVAEIDAHCQRAKQAGAEIVRELQDTDYGSREYSARDPEGHVWSFGTYHPAVGD
jgi:uncharacterized glyoxalase superfamily protein PhnB